MHKTGGGKLLKTAYALLQGLQVLWGWCLLKANESLNSETKLKPSNSLRIESFEFMKLVSDTLEWLPLAEMCCPPSKSPLTLATTLHYIWGGEPPAAIAYTSNMHYFFPGHSPPQYSRPSWRRRKSGSQSPGADKRTGTPDESGIRRPWRVHEVYSEPCGKSRVGKCLLSTLFQSALYLSNLRKMWPPWSNYVYLPCLHSTTSLERDICICLFYPISHLVLT